MDYSKAKKIYRIMFAVTMVLLAIGYFATETNIKVTYVLFSTIAVLYLVSLFFSFKYLRCPECNKYVASIRKIPYCPHCGNKLD